MNDDSVLMRQAHLPNAGVRAEPSAVAARARRPRAGPRSAFHARRRAIAGGFECGTFEHFDDGRLVFQRKEKLPVTGACIRVASAHRPLARPHYWRPWKGI